VRRKRRHPEAASAIDSQVSIGIFDKRGTGSVPPSAAIRIYRRARNSTASWLSFERRDAAAYAAGRADRLDVLLVVRDAFSSTEAPPAMSRASADGSRLVVDLDDDLFTDHAVHRLISQGYSRERLAALKDVVGRADQVTVSTPYLADLVRSRTGAEATVVPNELDPRLWCSDEPEEMDAVDPDEVRILYMGSKTHAGDLALLERLPAALEARLNRSVTLELVGVTPEDPPAGTRRLVPDKPNYAGFVRWLRRRQSRWHAAVAPLADTEFNAAKSDLKLLEYAALGLGTVASPTGPYAGAPDVLARLAVKPDEWVDEVAFQVAAGPAEEARRWVLRNRTMNTRSLAGWERTLVGATGIATPGADREGRNRTRS
jgi:hypothetical protein